ncbi:MAG TPA: hypothetical protein VK608_01980 [Edaphobacter sp.]|nr:hypothetical protein [Edaphobacter sp.]
MRSKLLPATLLLLAAASLPAFAKGSNERASMGSDITIAEGESAGDIACAFCSVRVHGDVNGNVAVAFGSVSVDSGHRISGNNAIFGGNLNLAEGAEIGGNVAIAAGEANLAPGAAIRGSRTILPGAIWLLVPFAPLLVVIGIIWLIVHLIRRSRYRFPVYPNGRGF